MTADVSYSDFVINPDQVIYLNDDNFKSCVTPAFVKKNGVTNSSGCWVLS